MHHNNEIIQNAEKTSKVLYYILMYSIWNTELLYYRTFIIRPMQIASKSLPTHTSIWQLLMKHSYFNTQSELGVSWTSLIFLHFYSHTVVHQVEDWTMKLVYFIKVIYSIINYTHTIVGYQTRNNRERKKINALIWHHWREFCTVAKVLQ